jgi:hypothetical protein
MEPGRMKRQAQRLGDIGGSHRGAKLPGQNVREKSSSTVDK